MPDQYQDTVNATVEPKTTASFDQCVSAFVKILGTTPFGFEPDYHRGHAFVAYMDDSGDNRVALMRSSSGVEVGIWFHNADTKQVWPIHVAEQNTKKLATLMSTVHGAEQHAREVVQQASVRLEELTSNHALVGTGLRGPRVTVSFDCR